MASLDRGPPIDGIPTLIDPELSAALAVPSPPAGWHQRSLYIGTGFLSAIVHSPYDRPERYAQRLCRAVAATGARTLVSLGPGDATFDRKAAVALMAAAEKASYIPVDVNVTFLHNAVRLIRRFANVPFALSLDFESRLSLLRDALRSYPVSGGPILVALTGGTFGNLDLLESNFIAQVAAATRPGDFLLFDAVVLGAEAAPATCDSAAVRRFLAAGAATQTGVPPSEVLASYERMKLLEGVSDVPGSDVAQLAYDSPAHGLVPVIRFCRYSASGLADWAGRLDGFEAVDSELSRPGVEEGEFRAILLRRR